MKTPLAPPRIDWVDRQLAAGRDFRAALGFLDARRARHLRGAHGTWGVALGLDVDASLASAPRIGTVGPGLAYDAAGRELVVDRRREVAIPDEAAGVVTMILAAGACAPAAAPAIAWARRPLRPGRDVPLATIDLGTGIVDSTRRPHVRTMAPPRVAGAFVQVGAAPGQGWAFGYAVEVDTSAAGFERAPLYLVQPSLGASARATGSAGLLGPFLDVADPQPGRFTMTVRYLAPTQAIAAAAPDATRRVVANPFAFSWVGVEPAPRAGVDPWPPTSPPIPL